MTNTIDEKLKEFERIFGNQTKVLKESEWLTQRVIRTELVTKPMLEWLKQALEEAYEEGLIDSRGDVEIGSDTKMPPLSSRKIRIKLLETNND